MHRADWNRELLDTGIVPEDYSIDALIADCWSKFQTAQSTVQVNAPANYIPSSSLNHAGKAPPSPAKASGGRRGVP